MRVREEILKDMKANNLLKGKKIKEFTIEVA